MLWCCGENVRRLRGGYRQIGLSMEQSGLLMLSVGFTFAFPLFIADAAGYLVLCGGLGPD